MSNLDKLNEQNKKDILSYFKEKYKIEVMDASFEELKEKGLYHPDTMSVDGVLLKIEYVEFDSKDLVYEVSIYKSAVGVLA